MKRHRSNQHATGMTNNSSAPSEPANTPSFRYGYYFVALQDYTSGVFTWSEVLLFEYLLWRSSEHLDEGHTTFWHSYPTIHKRTGITPQTARKYVDKFKKLGFVTTKLGQVQGSTTTFFTVDYLKIAQNIAVLYGGAEVKHTLAAIRRITNNKKALKQLFVKVMKLKAERKRILHE